jgi:hypothetical protein
MWNYISGLLRIGPHAIVLEPSNRPQLCAISGWAVAHGARKECLHPVRFTD